MPVSETASLDAQVLVAHILKRTRAWVLAHPQASLNAEQLNDLDIALSRLENGDSLPYVLGHWEFYGLDFTVTPDVLIPRPETELLVERGIQWLRSRSAAYQQNSGREKAVRPLLAADVGTGSGCIGIALAKNIPNLKIIATDISMPALKVAKANARTLKVDQCVSFVQADLLSPFPRNIIQDKKDSTPEIKTRRFDLICANLPYIPDAALKKLKVIISEPKLALSGGRDGLNLIRKLLDQIANNLEPNGAVLLEIEAGQGQTACTLARAALPNADVEILKDLAGLDRVIWVQRV